MTEAAQDVLKTALQLSLEDRTLLIHGLLASLGEEVEPEVDAAWAAEATRRAKKLLSGEDPGESWDDVYAQLLAEFPR